MTPDSRWKVLVVVGLLAAGGLTALPNLFGTAPALEIARADGQPVQRPAVAKVRATLNGAGTDYTLLGAERGSLVVRFRNRTAPTLAAEALRESLDGHGVALGFVSRAPAWLKELGLEPLRAGLDLGGGVELLYDVQIASALRRYREGVAQELEARFQRDGVPATARLVGDVIEVQVTSPDANGRVKQQIESLRCAEAHPADPAPGGFAVTPVTSHAQLKYEIRLSDRCIEIRRTAAVQKNIDMIRSSIPAFGAGQFSIDRQDPSRIRIRLSSIRAPVALQRFLETRARVEFRLADPGDAAARARQSGRIPPGSLLLEQRDGSPVLARNEIAASGEELTNVISGRFPRGHGVSIRLNDRGARQLFTVTETHIDKPIVVLLDEEKVELAEGGRALAPRVTRQRRLIDIAIVREPVSSPVWITGLTLSEADDLVLQLRAGAFAAPMLKVEERVIGPGIAREWIDVGRKAVIVAFTLVAVLMVARYGAFGVSAVLALSANLIVTLGALSLFRATFTLPSAGGVLTGAVLTLSACVWIIEHVRRERANGNTPRASVRSGYKQAAGTVIAVSGACLAGAVLLSWIDVAPLRDFAVATGIGSVSAAFASLAVTRLIVRLIDRVRQSTAIPIGRLGRS